MDYQRVSSIVGYHMSGEVISVLSLEGRYYNCHERVQRARDNYDIVTRVIQLISLINFAVFTFTRV